MRINYKKCVRVILALISFSILSNLLTISPADAATNCRKVMRDLQSEVIGAKADPTTNATTQELTKINQIVATKVSEYPECKAEFVVWYDWNQSLNPGTPFPFGVDGDVRTYPLGPVSWWWDKIYVDFFGRNIFLMFLFGWELFLGGIYTALVIPLSILGVFFPFLGRILKAPFRRRSRNSPTRQLPSNDVDEGFDPNKLG